MKLNDSLHSLLLMAMNSQKFTIINYQQKCLLCGKVVSITVKSELASKSRKEV